MSPAATQVSFLRAMKGAPASILMALLLTGRAHTQRELQLTTGYSDKPVSEGLALLELAGVVRHEERGWVLAVRPEELAPLMANTREPLSTTRNISDPRSTTTTEPLSNIDDKPVVVSTYPDPNETAPHSEPVENSPDSVDNQHSPRSADNQEEVRAWLERAGVGSRSPKMRRLLAAGLSARYVQAHVLEREYRLRWHLVKPGDFRVGLLIRRLEDGDPAPPMRCPVCLEELPCRYGH